MRKKTLLGTTKRVAYLGTLAMGLLIAALASCEKSNTPTDSTNNAPPYVGTYRVDSVLIFVAGSRLTQGTYTGTVTVKDVSAAGDTIIVNGQSVKINASVIIAAGNAKLGNYPAVPVTADTTIGNLTDLLYKTKYFTAVVTKVSDTTVRIAGIAGTRLYAGATAGATATLYLTKIGSGSSTTNTPPPYVGTYGVDSVEIFSAGSLFGKATYTGDVTIKDISAAGDTMMVSGEPVKINASVIIAAGNANLGGIYPPVSVPADTTRGNLTSGAYTIKGFTKVYVGKLSETSIRIVGLSAGKFPSAPPSSTVTLYLTKK